MKHLLLFESLSKYALSGKLMFSAIILCTILIFPENTSGQCNPDLTTPTVSCIQNIAVGLDPSGIAIVPANLVDNNSFDNCMIDTIFLSRDSFTCADIGLNLVKMTVIDTAGNKNFCNTNIDIQDKLPPKMKCKDIVLHLDKKGEATAHVDSVDDGSSDACGIDTIILEPYDFDCNDIGVNLMILTATDVNGNADTCYAIAEIIDSISPNAICKSMIDVYLNSQGTAFLIPDSANDGSFDVCGIFSFDLADGSYDCADLGSLTDTLIVTDSSGNNSECTLIVNIIDSISPDIICQNDTFFLNANGNVAVDPQDFINSASDNCLVDSFSIDLDSFFCANTGQNAVTVTVYDQSGNSTSCSPIAIVLDTIDPIAICKDTTIYLNSSGNYSITPAYINNNSTDNCDVDGLSVTPASFNCLNIGPNQITLTVTDASGNTANCMATVTVADTVPPQAICSDATIYLDTQLTGSTASLLPSDIDGGSSDACDIGNLSISKSQFNCQDLFSSILVTLYVSDANGNVDSCTAQVTVLDTVKPELHCRDITIALDSNGNASISANFQSHVRLNSGGPAYLTQDNIPFEADNYFSTSNTFSNNIPDILNTNWDEIYRTERYGNNFNYTIPVPAGSYTVILHFAEIYYGVAGGDTSGGVGSRIFNVILEGDTVIMDLDLVDSVGSATALSFEYQKVVGDLSIDISLDSVTYFPKISAIEVLSNSVVVSSMLDNCNADLSLDKDSFDCSDVGVNLVTVTATDSSGNISTCQAMVTVVDTISPQALCKDVDVYLNANGHASITPQDVDDGSSDVCEIDTMYLSLDEFTCADTGLQEAVLTVIDSNGNASDCVFDIMVYDTIKPVAFCTDTTIYLDQNGSFVIDPSYLNGGSYDSCGIALLTISQDSFDCSDLGNIEDTLTVLDVNGNSSYCIAVVTVLDTISPEAECQDITVYLDSMGFKTIDGEDLNNGSSDACGIESLTLDNDSFTCAHVGIQLITLTVTDSSGNAASASCLVTVEDTIAPKTICADFTTKLGPAGSVSITPIQIDSGSHDACGIISLQLDTSTFDCSDTGDNQVVLTATDVNGNTGSCKAVVTIVDENDPTAICIFGLTVSLNDKGIAIIPPLVIDAGSFDNCEIIDYNLTPGTFDCSDIGTNTVTLIVTDASGNQGSCNTTIGIQDNLKPVANCQDLTVYLDASGQASILPTQVNDGSFDNCGIASYDLNKSDFDCSDVGLNLVVLTVTDVNGNSSQCESIIHVIDTVPPVAICKDIMIFLDFSGDASIEPEDIDNGSNDACGVMTLLTSQSDFDCSHVGPNIVMLTVIDSNTNVSACSSTVTVKDTVSPEARCKDIKIFLDFLGNASIQATDIDSMSSDACGIDTLLLNMYDFNCSNVGSNPVELTVIDVNGNSAVCSANVDVNDSVLPVAQCSSTTVYLNSIGIASIGPLDIDNGSSDACGIDSLYLDKDSFNCSDIPFSGVTLFVIDVNGNTSSCSTSIQVIDTVRPDAICQNLTIKLDSSGSVTINTSQIDAGSNDACGISSIDLNKTNFDCSNVGANQAILIVTDINGNTDSCHATVNVNDNTPPLVSCKDISRKLDMSGKTTISAIDISQFHLDACGIDTLIASSYDFGCSDVGDNKVVLTVYDVNGNSDTCHANVSISDNTPPDAICQDITVYLQGLIRNVGIAVSDIDNGSTDACGIDTMTLSQDEFDCDDIDSASVILTVIDVNGNVSTCKSNVTVIDTIDPVAMCQDYIVYLDSTGMATIDHEDIDAGSYENCDIDTILLSKYNFDCSDTGTTIVTMTVIDVNGNSSSCTAEIQTLDSIAPVALCRDIDIYLDTNGSASISGMSIDSGSFDACGILMREVSKDSFYCDNVGNNSIVLTVTDVNGNLSTCTANVEVLDTVAPMIICNDDTVCLDKSGQGNIVADSIGVGTWDACGISTLSLDTSSFDCDDLGTNTVILTAVDINGNSSSCTAIITVKDKVPPVPVCTQGIAVTLNPTGSVYLPPAVIDNGSFDNCGTIDSIALYPNSFNCSNIGVNIVKLTVWDSQGNNTFCSTLVTIQDNVFPKAKCKDVTLYLDNNGAASVQPSQLNNNSTDNCGIDSLILSKSQFACSDTGPNTVQLSVIDLNGNVSNCNSIVTVIDTVTIEANCINITAYLDASGTYIIDPSDLNNGSSDACGIQSLNLDKDTLYCQDRGGNTIILTVTDPSGNSDTCHAFVSVLDTVTPVARCKNIVAYLDETGNVTLSPFDIDDGSSDACGITGYGMTQNSFNCNFIGGSWNVLLIVTDISGNSSYCTSIVTVQDTTPPQIVCSDSTIELDIQGVAIVSISDLNVSVSDGCGISNVSLNKTVYNCSDIGQNMAIVSATDIYGNTGTCTATVTIQDIDAPSAVCQDILVALDSSGNASIDASDVDGGSSDACSMIFSVNQDTFDCSDLGPNSILLSVTDSSGNSSLCVSTVAVVDTIDPVAICKDITVYLDAGGFATLDPQGDIDDGSYDVCAISSYSLDKYMLTCSEVGTDILTLYVTDEGNNTSSCTALVTVVDTFDPVANCRDTVIIGLDQNGELTLTVPDIDNFSFEACELSSVMLSDTMFNCNDTGYTTVTLTLTDNSGNTSSCQSVVHIVDGAGPYLDCKDLDVYLDENGNSVISLAEVVDSVSDACGFAGAVLDKDSFDCSDIGANIVTVTATDISGNQSICQPAVNILDTISPVASCTTVTVYLNEFGSVDVPASAIATNSSDVCGVESHFIADMASIRYDCSDLGSNSVVVIVADSSGNESQCTGSVIVQDTTSPDAVCKNITLQLNPQGVANLSPSALDGGSYDACGIAGFGANITIFNCADTGSNTVILAVYDSSGNVSQCQATVTLEDNVHPVAICIQGLAVSLDTTNSEATVPATSVNIGSYDNCGIASLELLPNTFTCDDLGIVQVTLYVTDVHGNVSSCNTTIDVQDNYNTCVNCDTILAHYATDITYNSARLNWTTISGMEYYEIRGRQVGTSQMMSFMVAGGESSFLAQNLHQGTDYEWQIRGFCSTGQIRNTDWKPMNTFTTVNCEAPQQVATTAITETRAILNWEINPEAARYVIRGREFGSSQIVTLHISNPAQISRKVTGLQTGYTYQWQIASVCGTGIQSDWSTVETFTTSSAKKSEAENGELSFTIYPNPTDGFFKVSISELQKDGQLFIYDILGKKVMQHTMLDNTINIDMSSYEKGTYLIQFKSGDKIISKKLIID